MSHRVEHKQAARAERPRREQRARAAARHQRWMRWGGGATVAVIAATLLTIAITGGGAPTSSSMASGMDSSVGSGPRIGAEAPAFSLTDAVSGKRVDLRSLAGHKTLLFFSEGIGCQACMVQAAELQRTTARAGAGIRLVSVTTDPLPDLAQAARQYGIRTPLLADPSTTMSADYGMLGHGGMGHPTQDGHAFMLLDASGKVLWHQAYRTMYVSPGQLMSDMGPLA